MQAWFGKLRATGGHNRNPTAGTAEDSVRLLRADQSNRAVVGSNVRLVAESDAAAAAAQRAWIRAQEAAGPLPKRARGRDAAAASNSPALPTSRAPHYARLLGQVRVREHPTAHTVCTASMGLMM